MVVATYHVTLDCVATGNPQPVFSWYEMNATYSDPRLHHQYTYQKITTLTDSRYTFTSGRLTIQVPRENLDAGTYQCKAENQYGSILSEPMDLSFGCKLFYLFSFDLWFYVRVNNYGHVETVTYPNHTVPGQAS